MLAIVEALHELEGAFGALAARREAKHRHSVTVLAEGQEHLGAEAVPDGARGVLLLVPERGDRDDVKAHLTGSRVDHAIASGNVRLPTFAHTVDHGRVAGHEGRELLPNEPLGFPVQIPRPRHEHAPGAGVDGRRRARIGLLLCLGDGVDLEPRQAARVWAAAMPAVKAARCPSVCVSATRALVRISLFSGRPLYRHLASSTRSGRSGTRARARRYSCFRKA